MATAAMLLFANPCMAQSAQPITHATSRGVSSGTLTAPVSVTFLNAMRLDRDEFIATITLFVPIFWSF